MISAVHLTDGVDDTAGNSFETASITPGANKLIFLSFTARNGASTNPTISSIVGNGLTWELVNSRNWDPDSSSRRTTFVYRAMGASPSGGTIVVTCGQSNTNYSWSIEEFDGVDTSGTNGSGAIVQSATALGADPTTTLTVTLAAFGSTDNATFGAFGEYNNATATQDTGFTLLCNQITGTGGNSISTEFLASNDTSVAMTFSTGTLVGGVGVEIKAAVATAIASKRLLVGVGR